MHNGNQTFHDLIILKTNNENIILDGFYYRLEWAEVPSQFMIFRCFAENAELRDRMKISELEFINEYEAYDLDLSVEVRELEWCSDDIIKF